MSKRAGIIISALSVVMLCIVGFAQPKNVYAYVSSKSDTCTNTFSGENQEPSSEPSTSETTETTETTSQKSEESSAQHTSAVERNDDKISPPTGNANVSGFQAAVICVLCIAVFVIVFTKKHNRINC
ncbi:MAG: hypothetical protein LUG21_05185 [Clostridiales bacterium]|nr:hypothetical protein [Clostridiales bacterium]